MTISVVIPTYNMVGTLLPLITQLNKYIRPKDEIIVVDNGSTDDTNKFCKQLLSVGLLTKYIVATDKASSYYARNVGVKAASGSHILFLDADVSLTNNIIYAYTRVSIKNIAVVGSVKWVGERPYVGEVMDSIELRTANVLIPREWLIVSPFKDSVTSGEDVRYLQSNYHVFYPKAVVNHHISVSGVLERAYRYGSGRASDFDLLDYVTFNLLGWLSTAITMISHFLALDNHGAMHSLLTFRYLWWYKTGQLVKLLNPKKVIR